MASQLVKGKKGRKGCGQKAKGKAVSYRLKCTKTANGLSHYVMYGDAEKKTSLL